MAICNNKKCSLGECDQPETCAAYVPVLTNADKIRAMSDEEITEFVCRNGINTLCDIICGGECNAIASFKKSGDEACKEIVMKWLKQPCEGALLVEIRHIEDFISLERRRANDD